MLLPDLAGHMMGLQSRDELHAIDAAVNDKFKKYFWSTRLDDI
ncbi:hypothetical protein ACFQPF_15140 [Fictibacillus iocasae]|uniref:Uncharacterized protein n=1 Tax=Fictibacillus iocasae TaxID=2715437 RepID=A0ABW2NUP3_9BACL